MNVRQPLKFKASRLWLEWTLATAAAVIWGSLITHILWFIASDNLPLKVYDSSSFIGVPVNAWLMAGYLLLIGSINALCLGAFQWAVLRRLAPPFQWWFWAAAAPLILLAAAKAGYYVVYDAFLFRPDFDLLDKRHYIIRENAQLYEWAFTGIIIGLLQWLVLRKVAYRAAWWIFAAAVLYFPAVIVNLICRYVVIERFPQILNAQTSWIIYFLIAAIGAVFTQGFLMGALLIWLLKRPPPLTAQT